MLKLRHFYRYFAFSTNLSLDKFRVADKILHTFYHHDGRHMLTDAVAKQVSEIDVDSTVKGDILNLFNPQGGISMTEDPDLQLFQGSRAELMKNQSDKMSFFPHSAIMRPLMRTFYSNDRISKQVKIPQAWRGSGIHLIGSPGISKTLSFYMLKYFHDLRVSHLIKHECPADSHFEDNFKIFYFHSTLSRDQIIEIMKNQVKKDFRELYNDQVESQIFKNSDLRNISQKIFALYRKRQVEPRVIVDQFNQLCEEKYNKQEKQKYVQNWQKIYNNSSKPIIFVSSKHKILVDQQKTIKRIIGTGLYKSFEREILDNQISPQERIVYTVQSLIFQLAKFGLKRGQAIEIVRNFQYFPMITHLSCAQFYMLNLKGKQYMDQQQIDQLKGNIKILNQVLDSKINQQKQSQIQQLIYYELQFYDRTKPISGNQNVWFQKISSKIQINKTPFPNYFFSFNQNGFNKLYSCFQLEQISDLKNRILYFPTEQQKKAFTQIAQKYDIKSIFNRKKEKGYLFESIFDLIIREYQLMFKKENNTKQKIQIQFVMRKTVQVSQCIRQEKIMPMINDYIKNYENVKIKNQWPDFMVKQIANKILAFYYYKTKKFNLSFDYLIPMKNEATNSLNICLVDCNLRTNNQQKIQKFKNQLLSNDNFICLITKVCQMSPYKNLGIFYVILKPEKYSFNEEQKKFENKNIITDYCCNKIKQISIISEKLSQVRYCELIFFHDFQISIRKYSEQRYSKLMVIEKYYRLLKNSSQTNSQQLK